MSEIARSSGRDHHCTVVLPNICFAAWLCTMVYVEKAVCVYIIFGPGPWDFDSWLQARLSDTKEKKELMRRQDEEYGAVLFNTFSLCSRG